MIDMDDSIKPQREERSHSINNSIKELKSAVNELEALSSRISGNIVPLQGIPKESDVISLEGILSNTPSEIRDISKKIHQIKDEISEKLF